MIDLTADVEEAYRGFVFECDIVGKDPHTGSRSVIVDVRDAGFDREMAMPRYSVSITIFTGTYCYEFVPRSWLVTDDVGEVEMFRFAMTKVCKGMIDDETFDTLLRLYEL